MSTKNCIYIVVVAALLVSCAHLREREPGKRTEWGTVQGVTASQITLLCSTGKWAINRTPGTAVLSGTLAVGSWAEVESYIPDWHKL